jgi:hypothetical protein
MKAKRFENRTPRAVAAATVLLASLQGLITLSDVSRIDAATIIVLFALLLGLSLFSWMVWIFVRSLQHGIE